MMTFLNSVPRPSTRLNRGNLILAGAKQIDTGRVRDRLEAFREIHRQYIEAQAAVNEAAALVEHERSEVDRLDGEADKALVMLSAALQLDGEPQRNPFGRFVSLGPGKMKLLSWRRKAAAIRELATTLRHSLGVSQAVLDTAAAAEQAAGRIETALRGWSLRRTYLGLARQTRNTLGLQWDDAHRALNLLSRSVIEEPMLHAVLFARPRRSSRRPKESVAAQLPATTQPEAPEELSRTIAAAPVPDSTAAPTEDPLQAVRRLIEPPTRGTSRRVSGGTEPGLRQLEGRLLLLKEGVDVDARLLEDGAQGAFRHIPGMIRYSGVAIRSGIEPDLVTSCGLPMELEAKVPEPPDDLPVSETGQHPHQVATING